MKHKKFIRSEWVNRVNVNVLAYGQIICNKNMNILEKYASKFFRSMLCIDRLVPSSLLSEKKPVSANRVARRAFEMSCEFIRKANKACGLSRKQPGKLV